MTIVVSSNGSDRLVLGAVVCGVRGLGVKGSTIPSTGVDGPSPVYPSLALPADANKEYRVKVVTPPSPGVMKIGEVCEVEINSLTNGNNSFVLKLYQDGVDIGNITNSIFVGATGVVASIVGVESGSTEVGSVDAVPGPSGPVEVVMTGVESLSAETGVVAVQVGDQPIPEDEPGENMRILYSNAIDRAATLVASSTAGTLSVDNLKTDFKTEVWRSTSTTATLTITWATSEVISMFSLPFCNLSATATMRVQGYTLAGDASPSSDTGNILCCPASMGFSAPWATSGANVFAYGGGVYATIWFSPRSVQKIVVTITDVDNASGYIEAARGVTGKYWSPERNVEWDSPKLTSQDDSKHERADSGSLWTDRGPQYKKLTFDLGVMTADDRNNMWKILRGNGMTRPVYVCVWPESGDAYDEQIYSIYGKLSSGSALQYKFIDMHATSLTMEEI